MLRRVADPLGYSHKDLIMINLSGKTALVTGASRGIGRASALALAKAGAQVLVHYSTGEKAAAAVVAEIRQAGGRAEKVAADLRAPDGPHALATRVRAIVGDRLDILVANAGISKTATIEETTVEDFDDLFAVNVRAPYFLVQQLLPTMCKGSSIVLLSSLAAHASVGTLSAYAATKGAIDTLVKHFASALGRARHPRQCRRARCGRDRHVQLRARPMRGATSRWACRHSSASPSLTISAPPSPFSPPTRPAGSPVTRCASTAARSSERRRYRQPTLLHRRFRIGTQLWNSNMTSDTMKLYHSASSPNSRRVRIFLAEKGLSIPLVAVDLGKGEQHSEGYRAINPRRVVPTLVLEDGTAIGEVPAICRYIEEVHPAPPLLGETAKEKALVAMWERRAELEGFAAVMEAVRNAAPGLKGRAIAGPHDYEQIPELAERSRLRVKNFFADFDARLGEVPFRGRRSLLRCRHHRAGDGGFRRQGDRLLCSGGAPFTEALVRHAFQVGPVWLRSP